jgi:hypothetical protein
VLKVRLFVIMLHKVIVLYIVFVCHHTQPRIINTALHHIACGAAVLEASYHTHCRSIIPQKGPCPHHHKQSRIPFISTPTYALHALVVQIVTCMYIDLHRPHLETMGAR